MRDLLRFLARATTPADRLTLVAAWAGVTVLAATAWSAPQGREAVITVGEREVRRLDLDRDQRVTVTGRLGPTELRVSDGSVRFVRAPCDGKRCIRRGAQHRQGASAACVPNRVMVRVVGDGGQGHWDAVNY